MTREIVTLSGMARMGLAYLATPYTKFPGGIEPAFIAASRLAARLMVAGVKVYSPIAHGHPLAVHGGISPTDNSIWLPFDEAMMRACDVLIVAMLPTWAQSRGVMHEIMFFDERGKPIFYLDPDTLTMSRDPDFAVLREKVRAAV